jgi:uncharacterized FlaG/YvyC family protein
MFPRKTKFIEVGGSKIEVHELTVCEVEDILQSFNRQEDKPSGISFLFKDLDEKIIKLSTNLTDDEIKQMPESVAAKVREAIRELNPFFSKAIDELIEIARKIRGKMLPKD